MKKFCCLTSIIILALFIVLLCIFLFVITPNMIGLGGIEVDGLTLTEMGYGDVTVFEILKSIFQRIPIK